MKKKNKKDNSTTDIEKDQREAAVIILQYIPRYVT